MSAEVIYFDADDQHADGNGWNVVSNGGSIAARFATKDDAVAWCEDHGVSYTVVWGVGQCDCGDQYVLGADDHCGECGSCWGCCTGHTYCDDCGEDGGDSLQAFTRLPVAVASANAGESAQLCPTCAARVRFLEAVGTGAPRNTGTLGAPALERVCTGAIIDGRLIHDGGTCFLHEGHLHDGENEAPAEWCVFVLTNAPAAYDYGYTVDTGRTEVRHRATCRLVMLSERHLRPQTDRYLSGAYMVEVW